MASPIKRSSWKIFKSLTIETKNKNKKKKNFNWTIFKNEKEIGESGCKLIFFAFNGEKNGKWLKPLRMKLAEAPDFNVNKWKIT